MPSLLQPAPTRVAGDLFQTRRGHGRLPSADGIELAEVRDHPTLNRLNQLASAALRAPVALVALRRDLALPSLGPPHAPTACDVQRRGLIDAGVCQLVVRLGSRLAVNDARHCFRARGTTLVRHHKLVAFCGVPMHNGAGEVVGVLCAFDFERRFWQLSDLLILEQLADSAMQELELQSEVDRLRREAVTPAGSSTRRGGPTTARGDEPLAGDAFLAQIGHELNNTMTPAAMVAELLESDPRLPDVLRNEIATLRRSLGAGSRLVRDLVEAARCQHGQLHLDLCATTDGGLAQLAGETIADHALAAGRAGVELLLHQPQRRGCSAIDADRLRQVLSNLLGNAMKFTDRGGTISVTVGAIPNGGLTLAVTDSGRGIDPAALPTLFDAFSQSGTRADRRRGLGLGLAICRGIVEAHGGTISVHSDGLGTGSTFRLELPPA